ncbi:MAG: hypothetical protein QM778_35160 [Myxococcales bacterium]
MATLHIELAHYPLVLCRLEGEADSLDTLESDLARYTRELLERRDDFTVVHDWTAAEELSEEARDAVFDQVIRNPALAQRCLGHFVISSSRRIRTTLTALSWMRPVSYPVGVTGMPEVALSSARRQLYVRTLDFTSRLERKQAGLNEIGF